MQVPLLDYLPLWLLPPLFAVTLWGAIEAGYRFGKRRHELAPDEREQPVAAIVASILGLLALVLGFTFGLAASRFDARRQAVLAEANAIGTTYLRTRFLPAEEQARSVKNLKEYVAVRLQAVKDGNPDSAIVRSEAIQHELWKDAVAVGNANPTSEMASLYIDSLNNLIDLHSVRILVGIRSRIPLVMWAGLFVMSFMGMASVGYQSGLAETRRSPVIIALIIAFTIVLTLIADLDRGREGTLRVGQQALVDVLMMMEAQQP